MTSATLRQNLAAALPPARQTIAGAVVWGICMALSLRVGLEISIEGRTVHQAALLALYFTGGVLSFPVAFYLVRLTALRRAPQIRFLAASVWLAVMTVGGTAALSALIYWSILIDWNNEPLTAAWFFEVAIASISALYQFAVIGSRHYLPLGIVLLVAASLWLTRATR